MDTTAAERATSHEVLERFLAGYWTPWTRANYRFILTRWLDWRHEHRLGAVGGVDAAVLETLVAWAGQVDVNQLHGSPLV